MAVGKPEAHFQVAEGEGVCCFILAGSGGIDAFRASRVPPHLLHLSLGPEWMVVICWWLLMLGGLGTRSPQFSGRFLRWFWKIESYGTYYGSYIHPICLRLSNLAAQEYLEQWTLGAGRLEWIPSLRATLQPGSAHCACCNTRSDFKRVCWNLW